MIDPYHPGDNNALKFFFGVVSSSVFPYSSGTKQSPTPYDTTLQHPLCISGKGAD